MNTLKTLIVAAVLSTLAYGVYSNYTARPALPPPSEALDWDKAPQVQLPPAAPQFSSGAPAALPPPPPSNLPSLSLTPPGNATALSAPAALAPPAALPPPGSTPPAQASPFETSTPSAPPGMPASGPSFPALPVSSSPSPSTTSAATPSGGVPPRYESSGAPHNSVLNSAPVAAGPTVAIQSPGSATPPVYPSTPSATPPGMTSPSATSAQNSTPNIQISSSAPPPSAPALVTNPYATAGTGSPTSYNSAPSAVPSGIIPAQPQDSQRERFIAAMGQVQGLLDQGQLAPALLALSEWHDDPSLPADEHAQLMDLLDRLAGTVIYSREAVLDPPYTVQPGDTLPQIADRCQVPWQLLAKINGIADPLALRPGERLKVVRGPFDSVVNLRTNEVTLLLRGHYAARFTCAVGQDTATPVGEYAVVEKRANPTYYGPAGVINADDPSNPLGERQIDIGSRLSLHGCNTPQGLSPNESRGCIRLSNSDIDDVFDILSVGSRVVVKR